MKNRKNIQLITKLLVVSLFSFPLVSFSALPAVSSVTSKKNSTVNSIKNDVYQQLTGNVQVTKQPAVLTNKIIASADKALLLARQSRDTKNYILAIKRYNFILKYYPKTTQAKLALIDKSLLYKEMGLFDQAAYNQRKVSLMISTLPAKQIKR